MYRTADKKSITINSPTNSNTYTASTTSSGSHSAPSSPSVFDRLYMDAQHRSLKQLEREQEAAAEFEAEVEARRQRIFALESIELFDRLYRYEKPNEVRTSHHHHEIVTPSLSSLASPPRINKMQSNIIPLSTSKQEESEDRVDHDRDAYGINVSTPAKVSPSSFSTVGRSGVSAMAHKTPLVTLGIGSVTPSTVNTTPSERGSGTMDSDGYESLLDSVVGYAGGEPPSPERDEPLQFIGSPMAPQVGVNQMGVNQSQTTRGEPEVKWHEMEDDAEKHDESKLASSDTSLQLDALGDVKAKEESEHFTESGGKLTALATQQQFSSSSEELEIVFVDQDHSQSSVHDGEGGLVSPPRTMRTKDVDTRDLGTLLKSISADAEEEEAEEYVEEEIIEEDIIEEEVIEEEIVEFEVEDASGKYGSSSRSGRTNDLRSLFMEYEMQDDDFMDDLHTIPEETPEDMSSSTYFQEDPFLTGGSPSPSNMGHHKPDQSAPVPIPENEEAYFMGKAQTEETGSRPVPLIIPDKQKQQKRAVEVVQDVPSTQEGAQQEAPQAEEEEEESEWDEEELIDLAVTTIQENWRKVVHKFRERRAQREAQAGTEEATASATAVKPTVTPTPTPTSTQAFAQSPDPDVDEESSEWDEEELIDIAVTTIQENWRKVVHKFRERRAQREAEAAAQKADEAAAQSQIPDDDDESSSLDEEELIDLAVTTIQENWRKVVHKFRERRAQQAIAATAIQASADSTAHHLGKQAPEHVPIEDEDIDEESSSLDEEELIDIAVTTLQENWRKVAHRFRERRAMLSIRSALKIQSVWRMKAARDAYRDHRAWMSVVQRSAGHNPADKHSKRTRSLPETLRRRSAKLPAHEVVSGFLIIFIFSFNALVVMLFKWVYNEIWGFVMRRRHDHGTTQIQTAWRRHMWSSKFKRQRTAAVTIQSAQRGSYTRRSMARASSTISRFMRWSSARLILQRTVTLKSGAAIRIQTCFRTYIAYWEFQKYLFASQIIQETWRGYIFKVKYGSKEDKAITIQRWWRDIFDDRMWAIEVLQRNVRMYLGMNRAINRYLALVFIQRAWRRAIERSEDRLWAAEIIQRNVRMFQAQNHAISRYLALVFIQRAWRRAQERGQLNQAATMIQKHWRRYETMEDYHLLLSVVVEVQAYLRRYIVRSKLEREYNAAIDIQRIWRGTKATGEFNRLLYEVFVIQKTWREYRERKEEHERQERQKRKKEKRRDKKRETQQGETLPRGKRDQRPQPNEHLAPEESETHDAEQYEQEQEGDGDVEFEHRRIEHDHGVTYHVSDPNASADRSVDNVEDITVEPTAATCGAGIWNPFRIFGRRRRRRERAQRKTAA